MLSLNRLSFNRLRTLSMHGRKKTWRTTRVAQFKSRVTDSGQVHNTENSCNLGWDHNTKPGSSITNSQWKTDLEYQQSTTKHTDTSIDMAFHRPSAHKCQKPSVSQRTSCELYIHHCNGYSNWTEKKMLSSICMSYFPAILYTPAM